MSGLQAGILLRSHAAVTHIARAVLMKHARMSLKKMSSRRQHMLLQDAYAPLSNNGVFTNVQVTH